MICRNQPSDLQHPAIRLSSAHGMDYLWQESPGQHRAAEIFNFYCAGPTLMVPMGLNVPMLSTTIPAIQLHMKNVAKAPLPPRRHHPHHHYPPKASIYQCTLSPVGTSSRVTSLEATCRCLFPLQELPRRWPATHAPLLHEGNFLPLERRGLGHKSKP